MRELIKVTNKDFKANCSGPYGLLCAKCTIDSALRRRFAGMDEAFLKIDKKTVRLIKDNYYDEWEISRAAKRFMNKPKKKPFNFYMTFVKDGKC